MKYKVDGTSTAITKGNLYTVTASQPTGTLFVHNYNDLAGICKYCGDIEGHDYIDDVCWKCWRSRNPGSME